MLVELLVAPFFSYSAACHSLELHTQGTPTAGVRPTDLLATKTHPSKLRSDRVTFPLIAFHYLLTVTLLLIFTSFIALPTVT